jgi:hypothetical protein
LEASGNWIKAYSKEQEEDCKIYQMARGKYMGKRRRKRNELN